MSYRFICILFCLLFLCSCSSGDSGSSKESSSKTVVVSGLISDPPINQAGLFLCKENGAPLYGCGASGKELCSATSDENGRFSFELSNDRINEVASVKSVGGTDSKLQTSFSDTEFFASFDSLKSSSLVVSPMTSVLYFLEKKQSKQSAKKILRGWLEIDDAVDLEKDPESDSDFLRKNILLGRMALEMDNDSPFESISSNVSESSKLIADNAINQNKLNEIFTTDKSDKIEIFYDNIRDVNSNEDIIAKSKRFLLYSMLYDTLLNLIKKDDKRFADHEENIKTNSDFIASVLKDREIVMDENVFYQVVRYILTEYKLLKIESDADGYTFSGPFVERTITKEDLYNSSNIFISEDETLLKFSNSGTKFNIEAALLTNEIPGEDNSKRMNYYFNSDISHLFLAEKTLNSIFDDEKKDYALKKIAYGYAEADLFDKAVLMADAAMYTPYDRVSVYKKIAVEYHRNDDYKNALKYIKEAEALFWNVLSVKGYSLFDKKDATLFQYLMIAMKEVGYSDRLNNALSVMDAEIIPLIKDNWRVYFQVLSAFYSSMTTFFKDENQDISAESMVLINDLFYKYARSCPPNESSGEKYYKMKIFCLANAALFYSKLGHKEEVIEIYNLINSIREDDGLKSDVLKNGTYYLNLTKDKTYVYMSELIEALARLGNYGSAEEKANLIADSFPDSSTYRKYAYTSLANVKVLSGDTNSAIDIVNNEILEKTSDYTFKQRIEALLYKNSYNPNVAENALHMGDNAGALKAMRLAELYIDSIYNNGKDFYVDIYKVEKGYLRLLNLFNLANLSGSEFTRVFEKCKKILNGGSFDVPVIGDHFIPEYDEYGDPVINKIQLTGVTGVSYYLSICFKLSRAAYDYGFHSFADEFILYAKDMLRSNLDNISISNGKKAEYLLDFAESAVYADRYDLALGFKLDTLNIIGSLCNGSENDLLTAGEDYSQFLIVFDSVLNTGEKDYILSLSFEKHSEISDVKSEISFIKGISMAAAMLNKTETAIKMSDSIDYPKDRFELLSDIAVFYASRDDNPFLDGIQIDLDGDGLTYFSTDIGTNPLNLSKIMLDQDSDNDGIPDVDDKRPLYKD